mmetsp:Transcript_39960/g.105736  ORF Transcript_39960/g.105736 Transcript_39960/m.105736 type:complete len:239 (-) Transcript_39960:660-1376(-)
MLQLRAQRGSVRPRDAAAASSAGRCSAGAASAASAFAPGRGSAGAGEARGRRLGAGVPVAAGAVAGAPADLLHVPGHLGRGIPARQRELRHPRRRPLVPAPRGGHPAPAKVRHHEDHALQGPDEGHGASLQEGHELRGPLRLRRRPVHGPLRLRSELRPLARPRVLRGGLQRVLRAKHHLLCRAAPHRPVRVGHVRLQRRVQRPRGVPLSDVPGQVPERHLVQPAGPLPVQDVQEPHG